MRYVMICFKLIPVAEPTPSHEQFSLHNVQLSSKIQYIPRPLTHFCTAAHKKLFCMSDETLSIKEAKPEVCQKIHSSMDADVVRS